jgi:sulfite reductase alpha subunit-like flavoprotein
VLILYSDRPTSLPVKTPLAANTTFEVYIELTHPATQRAVQALQDAAHDQATKTELAHLAEQAHDEIAIGRLSVLTLLELLSAVRISRDAFLSIHTRIYIQPYCILSSPF